MKIEVLITQLGCEFMNDFPYEDIINIPAPELKTRKPMPIRDRAAQFSPFAAVVGHDAAIAETARITEEITETDEYEKSEINRKLHEIIENISTHNNVLITYFKPDERKAGGAYIDVTGKVKKVDDFERLIVMQNGTKMPMDDILNIEGEIFASLQ